MRTPIIAIAMALLIVSMPICMASETSFQTDANGNLVYDGQFYREYNGLNQLVRVYNATGTLLEEFEHDPVEERVIKKVTYNPDGSPNETVIYFDKDYVRVDYHNGTVLDTEYVFLNGQMVAQVTNDNTIYVHGDHLGSTSTMTDENGDIVENTLYSPYGEVLSGGRELRYGYEGKEHSGLNLPTEGLVSYYSFENAAKDDTSNHDGNITGATETIGKVNKAYHFNGSQYITIGQNADFGDLCLNGCTISGWVKIGATGNYALLGRWDSARYTFLLRNYGNDVDFYLGNGSSSCRSINTGDNIPHNTWQHFVGVYNKTHTMTFLNGVRRDLDACTMTVPVVGPEKTYIGMYDDSSFSNKMLGDIDEVGIWDRGLTATEVQQVYEYSAKHDSAFRETDFDFRMYNPEIGMFTKPDTIIENTYEPQDLNHYLFENANPYLNTDPTGHSEFSTIGSGGPNTPGQVERLFIYDVVERKMERLDYARDQLETELYGKFYEPYGGKNAFYKIVVYGGYPPRVPSFKELQKNRLESDIFDVMVNDEDEIIGLSYKGKTVPIRGMGGAQSYMEEGGFDRQIVKTVVKTKYESKTGKNYTTNSISSRVKKAVSYIVKLASGQKVKRTNEGNSGWRDEKLD